MNAGYVTQSVIRDLADQADEAEGDVVDLLGIIANIRKISAVRKQHDIVEVCDQVLAAY